jgi:autotransporter-associated beta strand protein
VKAGTVSADLTGHSGLIKTGAGSVTLSGNNSFTGDISLNEGTLILGSASALGSTGALSFGGGTLQFTGSNTNDYSTRFHTAGGQAWRLDTNGRDVTLAANLSGSNSLTKLGAGQITLNGTNTYSGGTNVQAGTLFGGDGSESRTAFGSGVITVNAGATLWTDRGSLGNALVLNGGTLLGTNGFGETWRGNVTLAAASTVQVDYGMTFSGTVSGSGSLSKTGAGQLTL